MALTALATIYALKSPTIPAASRPNTILRFNGQTLAEAAAEFNRYNARRLVIANPKIAALRISGRFPATAAEDFAVTLKEPFGLEAVFSGPGPGTIRLTQRPPEFLQTRDYASAAQWRGCGTRQEAALRFRGGPCRPPP
jgi:hypothetical protein